jgi:hypothetical protein
MPVASAIGSQSASYFSADPNSFSWLQTEPTSGLLPMKISFLALACCLGVSSCLGDDFQTECLNNWHQWRGPRADGLAPHGDPPIQWSEKKNVEWKVAVPGEGHATPIVWGDRIFVLSAVKTEREVESLNPPKMEPPGGYKTPRPLAYYRFTVICIDRETGGVQWQRVACEVVPHEGRHGTNTYASASPTTDGRRLVVSFGSHGVFCYDLEGTLLWDRDLGDMVTRFGWGGGHITGCSRRLADRQLGPRGSVVSGRSGS